MAPRSTDERARAARADRILDAATDLLLRLGYRRVTVEDVAEAAGIGKGTVYLHWRTREELFLAALQRAYVESVDELVAALRAEPATVLLHRLTRQHYLGLMRRPLLRALYTADPQVLGRLARGMSDHQDDRHHAATHDYLRLLVEGGLLRTDPPVPELAYAYLAVLEGFLLVDSFNAPSDLALERKADLLATTVRHAFEPPEPPDPATVAATAARATELWSAVAAIDRTRVHPGPPTPTED
jgi:AcrR family transcriptional regulator